MKNILITLVTIALFSFGAVSVEAKTIKVNSYYKPSTHTYVQSYYKTSSNHTKLDNYSTKGNYNPYTGKWGTKKAY